MKRDEPPDRSYEESFVEGFAWLCALSTDDWQLLGRAYPWIATLIEEADRTCDADHLVRFTARIHSNWVRANCSSRMAPHMITVVDQGASDGITDIIPWVLRYKAGSTLVPDFCWERALERPFLHAKRFVEVARRAPGLADLLADIGDWTGVPEDFEMLVRQLAL